MNRIFTRGRVITSIEPWVKYIRGRYSTLYPIKRIFKEKKKKKEEGKNLGNYVSKGTEASPYVMTQSQDFL